MNQIWMRNEKRKLKWDEIVSNSEFTDRLKEFGVKIYNNENNNTMATTRRWSLLSSRITSMKFKNETHNKMNIN